MTPTLSAIREEMLRLASQYADLALAEAERLIREHAASGMSSMDAVPHVAAAKSLRYSGDELARDIALYLDILDSRLMQVQGKPQPKTKKRIAQITNHQGAATK